MILRALAALAALTSAAAVAPGSSDSGSMDSIGSVASEGGAVVTTNEGAGSVVAEQGASSSEAGSSTSASTTVGSEAASDMVVGESLLLGQPAEEAVKIRNKRQGGGDEFKLEAAGSTVLGHLDGEASMDLAAEQLGAPFLEHPEQPKSLDRMVGARQSWWGLSFIISIAIFAFGLALCNGIGQKIEKEELIESGQEMYSGKAFVPGALVSVTKAFMSNGEPPVQLRQGQTGVIQKIDAVGDALIRFADHSASQWVYEQNYQNLRVR